MKICFFRKIGDDDSVYSNLKSPLLLGRAISGLGRNNWGERFRLLTVLPLPTLVASGDRAYLL